PLFFTPARSASRGSRALSSLIRSGLLPLGLRPGLRGDLEVVMNVLDARDVLGDVLSGAFGPALVHRPGERHFAVADGDFDLAGVEVRVIAEPVIDVFSDPLVRTLVTLRAAPGVHPPLAVALVHAPPPLSLLVAEPRAHFVRGAIPATVPLTAVSFAPALILAAPVRLTVIAAGETFATVPVAALPGLIRAAVTGPVRLIVRRTAVAPSVRLAVSRTAVPEP